MAGIGIVRREAAGALLGLLVTLWATWPTGAWAATSYPASTGSDGACAFVDPGSYVLNVQTNTYTGPSGTHPLGDGGIYNCTSLTVGAGATLTTTGQSSATGLSGVLEFRVSGPVVIDGTISVSGASGGSGASCGGGFTGIAGSTATCPSGGAGGIASGAQAGENATSTGGAQVAGGGTYGGGGGGDRGGGGGGGGQKGGGGGAGGADAANGNAFGSGGGGGGPGGLGGNVAGGAGKRGSDVAPGSGVAATDGAAGLSGGNGGGGGGGAFGSLNSPAGPAFDPPAAGFHPGSGGGGGGSSGSGDSNGGGGGGGGGAIRITTPSTITINGMITAKGGNGGGAGAAVSGVGGGGGGGGSGGSVFLIAPTITGSGALSATWGLPGLGSGGGGQGGQGSDGYIKIFANSLSGVAANPLADVSPHSYPLTVNLAGAGLGTVTGSGIDCGVDCTEPYDPGSQVGLTATPAPGSEFAGFSGDCAGATCDLTMSADRSVTATFTPASGPPAGADTNPPNTQITKGPKDKTKKKTATFEFSASEPATFACTLDGKQEFKACTSPLTVKVKKGKHSFEVTATDAAGNADPTPATDRWKVKKKKKR